MNNLPIPAGVPLSWYLVLSAILFVIGVSGFILRRNIITVFMLDRGADAGTR